MGLPSRLHDCAERADIGYINVDGAVVVRPIFAAFNFVEHLPFVGASSDDVVVHKVERIRRKRERRKRESFLGKSYNINPLY